MDQDAFYTPMPKPPAFGQGFDPNFAVTAPNKKVTIPKRTIVVDSRQRDCRIFPDPSYYRVDFKGDVFKNITSLELRGAAIPRTSYNVHSTNNSIDFAIGSTVTYVSVIEGGSGYLTVPQVRITGPTIGTQATATAFIDTNSGSVVSIAITVPGSGYSPSKPPIVSIDAPDNSNNTAKAVAIVGTHYTAILRAGQYSIGGNPVPPSVEPSGFIKEIQNAMNYAVNGNPYDETSSDPFEVRLVSQYPEIDADPGTPEAANSNSSLFNRIQITNIDTDYWELLFCSGPNKKRNAHGLLGFQWSDQVNPYHTSAVITSNGPLISEGSTFRSSYDYNLTEDPNFVLLSFWTGNQSFERIQSGDSSINRKFGTMIFDANSPDVVAGTTGSIGVDSGINYLEGPVTKGTFWQPPGTMRALKGFDFDQKKIEFSPSMGKFTQLWVQFTKYGLQNGGTPEFYDFQNREHVLVLDLESGDFKNNMIAN